MTGTPNQIELAEQIRTLAGAEFDRVANALIGAAQNRTGQDRADTQTLIATLEEKRAEVMAQDEAGYFIREWRELDNQVRQLIVRDPRYLAMKANRGVLTAINRPPGDVPPPTPCEPVTQSTRQSMKHVTIKLTIKELEVLTSLASDQVFRREFIDPKMPGYKTNSEELGLSKVLVGRLRALIKSSWVNNQTHPAGFAG
jgi:hypothetical protein